MASMRVGWVALQVALLAVVAGAERGLVAAQSPAPLAPPAPLRGGAAVDPPMPARLGTLPLDGRAWAVRFSAGAERVAWIAAAGAREQLVVNDAVGPVVDTVDDAYVVGASDGHIAYAARVGTQWHPVIDHRLGEAYTRVSAPVADPAGRRIAFAVELDGAAYVWVDGELHGPYTRCTDLRVSADGRHAAWVGWQGGAAEVVLDGRALAASRGSACTALTLSPDGSRVGYRRHTERFERLCLNAQPVVWPRQAVAVHFGADGRHAFVVGRSDGRQQVWRDGRRGPVLSAVLDADFAPAGDRWSYRGVDDDGVRVFCDGRAVRVGRTPGRPAWSPDGVHVAWRTELAAGPAVVIDGQPTAVYPGCSRVVQFSEDGTQVVFGALRGRELWREVVPVAGRPAQGDSPR